MGFQAVKVWQFWQGRFRLPCGLRVAALFEFCARAELFTGAACGGAPAALSRNQTTTFTSSVKPKASHLFSWFHTKFT
jgi:hypothetical protein